MLMSKSPKAHILFGHMTNKAEMCPVTEKIKSKKSGWSLVTDWWFAQMHISQLYRISLKLQNLYLL